MDKDADAYRTISEVAQALDIPQHVLRFWETRFPQIRPLKRGGGRRYYRRGDIDLLRTIRRYLYDEGYTIRGVQRLLKSKGGGTPPDAEASSDGVAEASSPADSTDQGAGRTAAVTKDPQAAIVELAAEILACRTILDAALRASGGDPTGAVPAA